MWPGDYMLNFLRVKKLFWDLRIAVGIKSHPLFSRLSNPSAAAAAAATVAVTEDAPLPSVPTLERRSSGSILTPSAPYYASGTFGGGGIGKPLLLIPAISTYPLTAALRDELLNRVKLEQQQQQTEPLPPPPVDFCKSDPSNLVDEQEEEDSRSSQDPKDAGVLSSQQTNG
jgi:hypothetical protein